MAVKWSKEETNFLKDNYMVMADEELAEKLGKTTIQIRDKRNHEHLGRQKEISKEFLISEFWRFYNDNGRYPLKKELKSVNGYPSGVNYERKWNGWNNFLKEINVLGNDGWYKCDEQVLIDYYINSSIEEINNKLMIKRTKSCIMHKANKMNLYRREVKTEDDYKLIIEDYLDGMSCSDIAKKYGYTDGASIYYVLNKYNIELNRYDLWTNEQQQILKEYYPTSEWEILLDKLKPFDKDGIIHKASDLNIKRLVNSEWSNNEVNILNNNYGKISSKKLQELLPYRSVEAINTKACKLGLESRIKWSDEDILKLMIEYPIKTNKELSIMFGRTMSAIMGEAIKLGLKKDLDEHLYRTYNEEQLINDLKEFAKTLGKTPTVFEVDENKDMAHSQTYIRMFNGYVNACQKAGLEPNYEENIFITRTYRSKNNDLCLSYSEYVITNLYIDNNISYKKKIYYSDLTDDPRCGHKRTDWVLLNNIIVEFFGMPEKEFYQKRIKEKQEICADNNLILIELYPDDIKRGKNLTGLINKFKKYGIIIKNKEII